MWLSDKQEISFKETYYIF